MKRRHLEISLAVLSAYSLFSASLAAQPKTGRSAAAPTTPAQKAAPAAVPTKAVTPKPEAAAAPAKPATPPAQSPKAAPTKPKTEASVKASAATSTAPAKEEVTADPAAKEAVPAPSEGVDGGEHAQTLTEGEAPGDPAASAADAQKGKAGAAAAPAAAETPPVAEKPKGPEAPLYSFIRLYLSVASVWNKDPGYDFFSKDDVGQRIGLQADFDVLDLTDSVTLALEAGVAGESDRDGRTPSGLANEGSLSSTHLFGGVVGRMNLFPFLDLHARATGGASFTQLEFLRDSENLTEDVVSPLVGVGAGFSVRTEPRRLDRERTAFNSISFGARFEGGYVMSSKVELAFADQEVDIPEQRVRVQGAPLGALDRTGAYLDVAAFVNF